jgi:hypothetical protein
LTDLIVLKFTDVLYGNIFYVDVFSRRRFYLCQFLLFKKKHFTLKVELKMFKNIHKLKMSERIYRITNEKNHIDSLNFLSLLNMYR